MSNDLDTDINNYTYEELLEIVGFNSANIPETSQINSKLNKLINKYKSEKNKKYVTFFIDAKNKLLSKEDTVLLNDDSNPIINREKKDIQNVVPLNINQGTLNPNSIQTVSKIITIDSKYRQHKIPYSCDPNGLTSSTNFLCTLSEKIRNTTRLKLDSIYIPRTWYTFDDYNGNTCFWIDISNNTSNNTYPIRITEGNYTANTLKTEIQDQIQYQINNYPDISGLSVELQQQKIKFLNSNTSNTYTIYFYKEDNSLYYDTSCVTMNNGVKSVTTNTHHVKYNQNLGYNLGFRALDINNNLSIKLNSSRPSIIAEAPIDINGSQYFTLVIDDYNYNYSNNGGITIENKQNIVELPSYYSKIIHDVSCSILDETNIKQYLPSFPRKLTQAQLYSINEIIANKKKASNNKTISFNNSNQLAVIHLESINASNPTQSILYRDMGTQSHNERKYFGPVCIEKMHISLYDDNGNIVNLHGHNWSFTMIAEELYQY